jgi:nucleotide-binding universal stress UspA family protein
VDIVHVADPDPELIGYIKSRDPDQQSVIDGERKPRARALRVEHRQTQEFGAALRGNGVRVGQALTVQGPVLATILEQTLKLHSDLLMMGSHHYGTLHRLWHGDLAADAAKGVPCTLLLVPL